MGVIRYPKKVCLICAVCYQDESLKAEALLHLQALYGPLRSISEARPFGHTQYYRDEMGDDLKKCYVAFAQWIDPAELPNIKCRTNELELQWQQDGRRRINLDPGYIEAAKLVLASTKNFSHRIYIGAGIYGDVQLVWRAGHFCVNPWTYPDYREPETVLFFEQVRNDYWKK